MELPMADDREVFQREAEMPDDIRDWGRRRVLEISMTFDRLSSMAVLLNVDAERLIRMENDLVDAVVREAKAYTALK
jgi:hypothetical protein